MNKEKESKAEKNLFTFINVSTYLLINLILLPSGALNHMVQGGARDTDELSIGFSEILSILHREGYILPSPS